MCPLSEVPSSEVPLYLHKMGRWVGFKIAWLLQDIQSCDSSRSCVECEKNVASSETECPLLNCSTVLLIDAVNEDEYFINGEYP